MYSCVVARVGGRLTRIARGRGQGGLVFGWGEVAEGFVQAFLVVPGHPLSGCQLDLVDAAPGPASACSELVAPQAELSFAARRVRRKHQAQQALQVRARRDFVTGL